MKTSHSSLNEQRTLEQLADRLIEAFPPDPQRPVYTEIQLARKAGRNHRTYSAGLSEMQVAEPQEFCDELRFLISVTKLSPELRRSLQLWIEGWNQLEIARAFGVSQQTVSHRIRLALSICHDAAPLCFRRFSYHTIYRRPYRRRDILLRRCSHCDDVYMLGLGVGRYCSQLCQETALHNKHDRDRFRLTPRKNRGNMGS